MAKPKTVEDPRAEMLARIAELEAQLSSVMEVVDKQRRTAKNKFVHNGDPDRMYIRLADDLDESSLDAECASVPGQMAELAAMLCELMPNVNDTVDEATMFKYFEDNKSRFPRLATSNQSVTYVFKFYRGLRTKGFIARGFLRG